jgi:hypothetical protein
LYDIESFDKPASGPRATREAQPRPLRAPKRPHETNRQVAKLRENPF